MTKTEYLKAASNSRLLQAVWLLLLLVVLAQSVASASPAPAGTTIRNIATATYIPAGFVQTETISSNPVLANVAAVEALTLTQSQNVIRPPSVTATLSHLLSNTGNTPSSYTFTLANNGTGCAADMADLSSLVLVRDSNNNGVVDAGETAVTLNSAGAMTLQPGEIAALLVQGNTAASNAVAACVTLTATTALQSLLATNHDVVTNGSKAVLSLTKSASYPGIVIPGVTDIVFTVFGTSIGTQDVQPTATAADLLATPIKINGVANTLVLVRDMIPAGTVYNSGSLQTTTPSAIKLCRIATDAPFDYRLEAACGISAVEVAIGLPGPVVRNGSVTMSFSTRVLASQTGNIVNIAQGNFNDGTSAIESPSNTVVIATSPSRIGLAKAASAPVVNLNAAGGPDNTITVHFTMLAKNYGTTTLYDVQVNDLLEGAGTQFGSYTNATVPGASQYTVVAGSLSANASPNGSVSGTVVAVNSAFTGQAANQGLLAPGSVLPAGGEYIIQFDLRINITGRPNTLFNSAKAQGSLVVNTPADVFDDSQNGTSADPDGDNNPNNNSEPTPVSTQLPVLTINKTTSVPRRISTGVFELDYTFVVKNNGDAVAPNVRVIDNLNCTFEMDLPTGHVQSWQLMGPPVVQNGPLLAATSFTGNAPCDRSTITNTNALSSIPYNTVLTMSDGSKNLLPGESSTFKLTVRATKKAAYAATRTVISNKAWAASFVQNSINLSPALLVAASSSTVQSLLADPMGTVYNAVTRQPVAGAVVTIKRNACNATPVTPIVPAEILGADVGYTFNADGSLSMTTGVDGVYQFFFQIPPVNDLCTYSLSVVPPVGSGYIVPSQIIPVTAGTFAACGPVVPNNVPPQGAEPTTHYFSLVAGYNPATMAVCEVVNNHIPLDPGILTGLVLKKEGNKSQVEFGDFMEYALTVTNKTGVPLVGIKLTDALPPGFAYVKGSSRLDNVAVADPSGGTGPSLVFNFPAQALAAEASLVLRYRVRVGVGAPTNGSAINRARAFSDIYESNLASYKVMITGGVFSDDAYLFGKVYLDCKANGIQGGADEKGIPGVRLYLEDGTNVITDIEGKWSLYGLKPITHVVRLDQTTLPRGAVLGLLDNRNSNAAESRFADLKKGEFHKANFIVTNCDDAAMVADVDARRKALDKKPAGEGEALVSQRLDAEGRVTQTGDVRALPATGQALVTGVNSVQTPNTSALIQLPVGSTIAAGALASASGNGLNSNNLNGVHVPTKIMQPALNQGITQAEIPSVSLEELMPSLDNSPGFIGLKDNDTTATQGINVRVKGGPDVTLRLSVNGVAIAERRVGKKAVLPSKQLTAWEYIGVQLNPGINTLKLDVTDSMGNVRDTQQIKVTAPDKLGEIHIDLPEVARADQRTPVPVTVRLTDAKGVPVTARTQLTLETDLGRWIDEDLNPLEPGHQTFIEGGKAEFKLMPPAEPGDARVRVSANSLIKEVRLVLLPELRPMIAVGIVEGTLDFTKRGSLSIGGIPAGAAFESELRGMKNDSDNSRSAGRAAFFLKGAVKGDYLLTAAYDSDKATKDRLFRDIRPDEFYPVYGDSATKNFDAQSTQKFYLRVDKNRSYLLYGDFTTASSTEVRELSQTSRSLTGIKNEVESKNMRVTSYISRTEQTQQVEEFRALGTSGPYFLSRVGSEFVENSEIVEILVRDRNQPNIVLQRTPATRFVDYTIEPLTRRILFTRAIASVDGQLNPQSIRITYEIESGGDKFTVAGVDAQVKVTDKVQLGVVASTDENPENKRKLGAVTALVRLGENTSLAAELVRTDSDLKGSGTAARSQLVYHDDKLNATARVSKLSADFDNPSASGSAGRTEASAQVDYKFNDSTNIRGEALYSKDSLSDLKTNGQSVSVQTKLGKATTLEVGIRRSDNGASSSSASGFDYGQISTYNGVAGNTLTTPSTSTNSGDTTTTVRGRISTAVPYIERAEVFLEGEQDVSDSDKHSLAIGGTYAITDKTRAYGRYELISSLTGPYELNDNQSNNTGILGIESSYMEGGRIFNEYRLADSGDARSVQAAVGIRNTFKINDTLRATAGIEHTRALGGASNSISNGTGYSGSLGGSTAVNGGLEYLTDTIKASGILEGRNGDDADTRLLSAGIGYKINPDWSLLARTVISDSQGQGANDGNNRLLMRQQIGIALRPVNQDLWNALARYEHKEERTKGAGTPAGAGSSADFTSSGLSGKSSTDIVSAHVNYNPERGNYITGRYAGKISKLDDGYLSSTYWANLVHARYTKDLNKDWDIGVQAGYLWGKGGAGQTTLGLEAGYQVAKNLWVSAGYNWLGLKDDDLAGADYTSKGAYLRMRFKFDETTLGFNLVAAPAQGGAAATAPTGPVQ